MGKLAEAVRTFAAAHLGGPGVVAVSGGADSVALLCALHEVGAGPLTVGHVNHQLRGEASDGDEAFVRTLADRLGFRCEVAKLDPRPLGGNKQAAARKQRYDFLHALGGWLATGHTRDDQAETVLHHLIRGTGLDGLRGIAATGPVMRPLLTVGRDEVLAYLANLDQPFRTDASNADPGYTRNRIRAELLPLLRTFNPRVAEAVSRLAEQAAEVLDGAADRAAAELAVAERPRAGEVVILSADRPLSREAVRLLWRREGWPTDRMTHAHWRRLADLTPGDYPGGIGLRRVGRVAQIGRGL